MTDDEVVRCTSRMAITATVCYIYVRDLGRKIEISEYGLMYMVMSEEYEVVYKSCRMFADAIILILINESKL